MTSAIMNKETLESLVNRTSDKLKENQLAVLQAIVLKRVDLPGKFTGLTVKKHVSGNYVIAQDNDSDKPRLDLNPKDAYFQPLATGLKDYPLYESTEAELKGIVDRLVTLATFIDSWLQDALVAYDGHIQAIAERQEQERRANAHIVQWLAQYNADFIMVKEGKVYFKVALANKKNLAKLVSDHNAIYQDDVVGSGLDEEKIGWYCNILASVIPSQE